MTKSLEKLAQHANERTSTMWYLDLLELGHASLVGAKPAAFETNTEMQSPSLLQSWGFFETYSTIIGYVFLGHVTLLRLRTGLGSLACVSSDQFSCLVMSNSLRPHGLQHARPPCPSLTPGVHPTHVHRVSDAIQTFHPLLSPSPPALDLSQHQGLFQ